MYIKNQVKFFLIGVLLLLLPKYGYAAGKPYSKHNTLNQQPPKTLLIDLYGSPYVGASWISSARSWCNNLEDKYLLPKLPRNRWGRWSSTVLNNIANDLFMLTAHEFNGHGFRQRSQVGPVNYYGILPLFYMLPTFFLPMNGLGGLTSWDNQKVISLDIDLLRNIGGNEANAVLANELILINFQAGFLDHRTYNLFFKAFTNLLGYILITQEEGLKGSSMGHIGDIEIYIKAINSKHAFEGIRLADLKAASLVFFLNPTLYGSIWSFYKYIWDGQENFDIPRLNWESISYMPVVRMGLTPFGLAYYLDNYLAIDKQVFALSINAGSSPFYTSYYGGLTCQTSNLWSYKKYALDLTGSVWHQPKLQLHLSSPVVDQNHWGGLVGVTNKFQLNNRCSILATLHYKTEGFLEGIVADSGFGLQAGVTLSY